MARHKILRFNFHGSSKVGRMIIQNIVDADSTLEVMTLDPELEQILHNVIQQNQGNQEIILEPGLSEALFKAIKDNTQEIEEMGQPAVLVVSPGVRPWLSKTLKHRTLILPYFHT